MTLLSPVSSVQRLYRARKEAIRQDYETLAGIDRGRRLIWSGRPGVWYHARVIDLGRRPDVSRLPSRRDMAEDTRTADDVVADMRRYFFKRGNAPASIREVADAMGMGYTGVFAYLRRADLFECVRKGGGCSISLYVARDAHAPARSAADLQFDTLTPSGRRMVAALQAHGDFMRSDALAAAANVSKPIARRYANECDAVFLVDRRPEIINNKEMFVIWVSLQPEIRQKLEGSQSHE